MDVEVRPVSIGKTEVAQPTLLATIRDIAVPIATPLITSFVIDSIVSIVHPVNEKKEREKMYNAMQRAARKMPPTSAIQVSVPPVDNRDWVAHVEGAKEELALAESKVRCPQCKTTIRNLHKTLDSKTEDLIRNAKRQDVMIKLRKQGKLPE